MGHPETVKKMQKPFRILPYQHYAWGSALPLEMEPLPANVQSDHIELIPIHAPGHSRDLTVFWEKSKGWLFCGDLFIAERVKYFRSDEKMKDQIESLRKITALDFDRLFCAHNPPLENGKAKLQSKLQFLEDFYGSVKELHASGLDIDAIINKMGLKENYIMKVFCMGNLCMKNMVRSACASLN
jgi:glyoxylase-like metal-dependent hydrolase (beta-lactamase superfamily II)